MDGRTRLAGPGAGGVGPAVRRAPGVAARLGSGAEMFGWRRTWLVGQLAPRR